MPSGEKFCRKPPIQSSELSAPSTESSLLRPELPPVETAVIRGLVGSEGSRGAGGVHGCGGDGRRTGLDVDGLASALRMQRDVDVANATDRDFDAGRGLG